MCFLDLFVECGINGGFCVMYLSMVKSHILSMFFFSCDLMLFQEMDIGFEKQNYLLKLQES